MSTFVEDNATQVHQSSTKLKKLTAMNLSEESTMCGRDRQPTCNETQENVGI